MTMKLRYSRSFGWCMLAMVLAGTVLMTGCQMPFDTTLLEELKQQEDLPAATAIPAISAGLNHTVGLRSDGSVWAWGNNVYGQLGDGTTTPNSMPLGVLNLSDITAISVGESHTVALKSDGSVWAWGWNEYGQLGEGTTTDRSIPMAVTGLSGVVAIAAGRWHTVSLKSDGSVWAWGNNSVGQLGDGTTTNRTTPVPVTNLSSGVTAIAAGNGHNVALKSDGNAWAWGYNSNSQLGDGTFTNRTIPVEVTVLSSDVAAVAAGGYHTVALKSNGSVWAWGSIEMSQLGDGTTDDKNTPVPVSNLSSGVTAIAAGHFQTVALKSNGSAWAWGYNGGGQLGDGTYTDRSTPVPVTGLLSGVIAIDTGSHHMAALKTDGSVWAWGLNNYGQLGDGTTDSSATPVSVSTIGPFVLW
jgi:YD repeat-containing protein